MWYDCLGDIMTIENIALVRATNVIPFDGVVVPVSETGYLKKSTNEPFANEMVRVLKRKGLVPPLDYSQMGNNDYMDAYNKLVAKLSSEYIPYTSDYNSMMLFSLNGIVPDDKEAGFGNNTFSDKKCGIIDGLSAHIEDVISLNPTDTAIKGKVILSSESFILIEKDTYESLTIEEKYKLSKLNVRTFSGSLKDAINTTLINSQKYTAETLALSNSMGGYVDSATSDELKSTIKTIAEERNLSTSYHLNILLHNAEPVESLKSVEHEHENIMMIKTYYQNEFYKFLFSEMSIESDLQYYLLNYPSEVYIEQLCEAISDFGIENYKRICAKYNSSLEKLQTDGALPTPQMIVDSINKSMPIDLCEMIRNYNMEAYEETRQEFQDEEISKIQNIQNAKEDHIEKGKTI